uniref:CUB domain-containing protein n=1 Tax=Tetranychus urticae TaxID=32264 RepID=T1KI84_TETUR
MDFIRFSLEQGRDKNGLCNKDYLHLPDGDRLCGDITGRKSFIFPQTLNSSITLFFSSDGYRESPGFDILISQIPCGSPAPSPIIPDPYSSRRGLLRPPPTSQSLSPVSEQSEAKLCNKLINNQLAVITSPNYPSDYPPYSRCSYIIHRSSPDICQVKLQFLNLDLEKTSDCRTDYLQIEQTNEKYCGRQWLLPDKILRFPYNSDNLRLNFISDGQTNRPGFEIRVTQIRNSCFRPVSEEDQRDQKVNNVCDSSNTMKGVFRSGNYPAPYPANVNCIYRIEKYSRSVCRVTIMFSDFSVGTWERRVCVNDHLSIDGKRYCGYRRGEVITIDFPADQSHIDLTFKTDSTDHYGGFRIDYQQETANCGYSSINRRLISTGESCTGQIFYRTSFQISTPGIDSGSYEDNLDCGYLVRKASYDVCALEVKFNLFDLEESPNCVKDHLEIEGIKVCGKLPSDSVILMIIYL